MVDNHPKKSYTFLVQNKGERKLFLMRNKVTVKDKVLLILEENKGTTISGEALARALGVSRAAIWKAIKALSEEGYEITAGTNKGYCLDSNSDVLSMQGIGSYIRATPQPKLFVYDTVESTNKLAKQLAFDGALHGTCVIANQQTAGRGRLGRSFFSPAHSGIYLSIILRPETDMTKASLITTMAAVATARAISSVCGIDPDIKWVNDLYFMGKKICGILSEAVTDFESGRIESVVVGIGINCAPPPDGFPDELKKIAGFIPGSYTFSRNQLTAEIITNVMELCEDLSNGNFLEEYRERCLVLGKTIMVYKRGLENEGTIATGLDIDNNGALVVKYPNGVIESLSSGEISIRL